MIGIETIQTLSHKVQSASSELNKTEIPYELLDVFANDILLFN